MSQLKRYRPTPAFVVSMIALVFSISGFAAALPGKGTVKRDDLAKNAVTARSIAPGAVGSRALAGSAVTSEKIAPKAVTGVLLAPGAVTSDKIAPGAVTGGALGEVVLHSAPIPDPDTTVDFNWTPAAAVFPKCTGSEQMISGGVGVDNSNGKAMVYSSKPSTNAWYGQITSDSGGTAQANAYVLCLK